MEWSVITFLHPQRAALAPELHDVDEFETRCRFLDEIGVAWVADQRLLFSGEVPVPDRKLSVHWAPAERVLDLWRTLDPRGRIRSPDRRVALVYSDGRCEEMPLAARLDSGGLCSLPSRDGLAAYVRRLAEVERRGRR